MSARRPQRGDVWLTRLDPTVGNEIQKTRPCLVVSPNSMNHDLGTVVILPMTSGSHPEPFRPPSTFREVDGLILGDQIRSVSKRRLLKHLGTVEPESLGTVLTMLREMFEDE